MEDIMADNAVINNGMSGKKVSKWSMVIAGFWIAILSLVKAFWFLFALPGQEFGLTMNEIVLSGIMLAAIFTPIYLSVILDKIKEIKIGGDK